MSVLETKLNARSADFQANAAAMRTLVDDLAEKVAKSAAGGGEAARAKHVARGKLPPRERVQMLLDPGTPFLELSPLAAYAMWRWIEEPSREWMRGKIGARPKPAGEETIDPATRGTASA